MHTHFKGRLQVTRSGYPSNMYVRARLVLDRLAEPSTEPQDEDVQLCSTLGRVGVTLPQVDEDVILT